MKQFFLVAVLVAVGCARLEVVVPSDAGTIPSTSTDTTCEKLRALECPEGQDQKCPATLAKLRKTPIINLDETCVLRATTVVEAQRCAGFRCGK